MSHLKSKQAIKGFSLASTQVWTCIAELQGCHIFLGTTMLPNRKKNYQMTIKYTEWIQNIQNHRKIDQMVIKYTNTRHSKIYPNFSQRFSQYCQFFRQFCRKILQNQNLI
jgi:hypothetical protein